MAAAGTTLELREIPADALPVVGATCKAFLELEQLVLTAKSNKGDLAALRDLSGSVVRGFLDKRSARAGLPSRRKGLRDCGSTWTRRRRSRSGATGSTWTNP